MKTRMSRVGIKIYYFLVEAKPCMDNDEYKEFAGAYINCWVREKEEENAINKVQKYIDSEGWEIINIEEIRLASRDWYDDEPELRDCFDSACENGMEAIFYTWPIDENEFDG